MKKKVFSIIIALAMVMCLTPTEVHAVTCYTCLNEDGEPGKDIGNNVTYELTSNQVHRMYCNDCFSYLGEEPHTINSYTYNEDATCITGGTKTGTCTKCQMSVTVDDPSHPATGVHSSAESWTTDEMYHWHICTGCGAVIENSQAQHADTVVKDHKCDTCGKVLGTCAKNLEKVEQKAATTSAAGNIEYWHCTVCGKYFEDADAKAEITNGIDGTTIPKLPVITKRDEQTVTEGEKKALEFTSDAEFEDFIRVEVDGKTVDESNYTVKSGSTVVTLNADYVATLSAGEHTLGIVSQSGTATTKFTMNKKAEETNATTDNPTTTDKTKSPQSGTDTTTKFTVNKKAEETNATTDNPTTTDKTKSPQTGDNSNISLWVVLLFVSGGAVLATTVVSKKRKYNR